jgi:uncharacterized protein (TIGR00369 family)
MYILVVVNRNDQAAEPGRRADSGVLEAAVRRPDPGRLLRRVAGMDGLAVMEAIRDGALPGEAFSSAPGVRVIAAGPGRVTLGTSVDAWQLRSAMVAHGGFLSVLVDAPGGLAIHSTLAAGRACPHAQASYRFLRPPAPGTALTSTGQAVHDSRTLAVARAEITDGEGRLIAIGEPAHALVGVPRAAS